MSDAEQLATVRVAIAGCGLIAGGPVRDGRAHTVNHAASCGQIPGVELVAAADPDQIRREAFAKLWGVRLVYSEVAAMLAALQPDILIVATPPETHEAVCLEAVAAGVKGILCEKPLTGNALAAGRVVQACEAHGISLVANFARRWDTSHQAIAASVAAGKLGPIRAGWGCYTGSLRGNGSHLVDTLRMMVPAEFRIAWASALPSNLQDGEVSAVLLGPDGLQIHLACIPGLSYFVFELHLLGSAGRCRLLFQGLDLRIDLPQPHPDFPGYLYLQTAARLPFGTLMHSLVDSLAALVSAVRAGRPMPYSAWEHVQTLALLDQLVRRAHHEGESRT